MFCEGFFLLVYNPVHVSISYGVIFFADMRILKPPAAQLTDVMWLLSSINFVVEVENLFFPTSKYLCWTMVALSYLCLLRLQCTDAHFDKIQHHMNT